MVFSTICGKMSISDDVDLEDLISRPDKLSNADVNSICQEAGMLAVRDNRYMVTGKGMSHTVWHDRNDGKLIVKILDFEKAYANQVKNHDEMEFEHYHWFFSINELFFTFIINLSFINGKLKTNLYLGIEMPKVNFALFVQKVLTYMWSFVF